MGEVRIRQKIAGDGRSFVGEGEFAGEVVVPTDGEDGVVGEGERYDGKGFEREEGRQSGEV